MLNVLANRSRCRRSLRWCFYACLAAIFSFAHAAAAFAQPPDAEPKKSEGHFGAWLMAYVLMCLITLFGLMLVLRTSNRQERFEIKYDD